MSEPLHRNLPQFFTLHLVRNTLQTFLHLCFQHVSLFSSDTVSFLIYTASALPPLTVLQEVGEAGEVVGVTEAPNTDAQSSGRL